MRAIFHDSFPLRTATSRFPSSRESCIIREVCSLKVPCSTSLTTSLDNAPSINGDIKSPTVQLQWINTCFFPPSLSLFVFLSLFLVTTRCNAAFTSCDCSNALRSAAITADIPLFLILIPARSDSPLWNPAWHHAACIYSEK